MRLAPVLLITVLTLAGCTSVPNAPSVSTGEYNGPVEDFEVEETEGISALWVDGGERIAILTHGSSSCAPYPTAVTVVGESVEITTALNGGDVCSADMAANTFEVETPAGVDAGSELELVLVGKDSRSELTVPAL